MALIANASKSENEARVLFLCKCSAKCLLNLIFVKLLVSDVYIKTTV